jgi:hypothetical protein
VGGFPSGTTEAQLRVAFESAGFHVGRIALIVDRATGASRRFAFIDLDPRFQVAGDAELIGKFGSVMLDGHALQIQGVPQRQDWIRAGNGA